ncbi:MAG: methionine gamma-lyase family protein [Clostridiales bacterium]|jgi:cystathionine beta-lyase family protein involved in aluminum resistance|nr:methionine gamma-lyase family protein [Clostridiales bacterium]
MDIYDFMQNFYGISHVVINLAKEAESALVDQFAAIDGAANINQLKILLAMQKNRLSDTHFTYSTGYGYNDAGRDTLEDIFADVFHAESALVRVQIISGTHALAIALSANLSRGDELLSITGKPYDTLDAVIGLRSAAGSLSEQGVTYAQVNLKGERVDYDSIISKIKPNTKIAFIQRSKGYTWRESLTMQEMGTIIGIIKSVNPQTICMVDNCYGEFVEDSEPIEAGADLAIGSLIKNPGGGLAPAGGYIVGKKDLVERCAARLTAPGLGREVGPSLGATRSLCQGLFFAPQAVNSSLRAAMTAAYMFEKMGFDVNPRWDERRGDIVQSVRLGKPGLVLEFCEGIQQAAPVDSFVRPEPWAMPGYDAPVIMAAGAFNQGSSIELSADAPMKEPYDVYFQGGLTRAHGIAGVVIAAQHVIDAQHVMDAQRVNTVK